jgi:hypothetical protein
VLPFFECLPGLSTAPPMLLLDFLDLRLFLPSSSALQTEQVLHLQYWQCSLLLQNGAHVSYLKSPLSVEVHAAPLEDMDKPKRQKLLKWK